MTQSKWTIENVREHARIVAKHSNGQGFDRETADMLLELAEYKRREAETLSAATPTNRKQKPQPVIATKAKFVSGKTWRITVGEISQSCTFDFTPKHNYPPEEDFRISRDAMYAFESGPQPGEVWVGGRGGGYIASRELLTEDDV
jgi:hypothetical protein